MRRSGAGAGMAFGAVVEPSDLDGVTGFRIDGEARLDFAGASVSSAGDVNGDGLADLLVGAPGADTGNRNSGAAYVVFGRAGGFGAELALSDLEGVNGFKLSGGAVEDGTGSAVSSAGDVNGDGFDDILVGALGADPNDAYNAGAAYVIYGREAGAVRRIGGRGNDALAGGDFGDTLRGGGGDDRLDGGIGGDVLVGGAGLDVLRGEADHDRIFGGQGSDDVAGGDGDDRLVGGAGADILSGGAGADRFVLRFAQDSTGAGSDVIRDFEAGRDRIVLRKMDADPNIADDQAFAFRGASGFTGAGAEVAVQQAGGDTLVLADLDGDRQADLRIVLEGSVTLDAAAFLL